MTTPAANRYAPTSWGGSAYTELTMPSGQLCLVRKLQPIDLAAGNLLGGTDLIAGIVEQKVREAQAGPQDHKKSKEVQAKEDLDKVLDTIKTALSKPESLDSMIDAVTVKAVVEPRIEIPPKDYADRVPGVVYSDTVDFSDKMYIFNWVMRGVDAAKAFRGQSTADVASLEAGEGVPDQA